jgi:hypothetical protein
MREKEERKTEKCEGKERKLKQGMKRVRKTFLICSLCKYERRNVRKETREAHRRRKKDGKITWEGSKQGNQK